MIKEQHVNEVKQAKALSNRIFNHMEVVDKVISIRNKYKEMGETGEELQHVPDWFIKKQLRDINEELRNLQRTGIHKDDIELRKLKDQTVKDYRRVIKAGTSLKMDKHERLLSKLSDNQAELLSNLVENIPNLVASYNSYARSLINSVESNGELSELIDGMEELDEELITTSLFLKSIS